MTTCPGRHLRIFRRVAELRLDDAFYLYQANRNNAAIYLAGYVIECCLKCLLLSVTPDPKQDTLVETFRGGKAHDYELLKLEYRRRGGPGFPRDVAKSFQIVKLWSTNLRYSPQLISQREAMAFLEATRSILNLMRGRV